MSGSNLIFELKYRRVNEGYLYKRENCGNARGTRFRGSVLELRECRVAETLPWRNLRSKDLKGINKGTRMQRRQKGICTQKLGNSDVCWFQVYRV